MGWFLAVSVISQLDARIQLTMACDRADSSAVAQQLGLELRNIDVRQTRVLIDCAKGIAALRVRSEVREVGATVDVSALPSVAVSRALALAAVELVLEAQRPKLPAAEAVAPPVAPTVTPSPEAPRFWFRAGGGIETGLPLLAVGQASAAIRLVELFFVGLSVSYARAHVSFPSGFARSEALDGTLTAQLVVPLAVFLVCFGLGARVGHVWLRGEPMMEVDAGAVSGPRGAPMALLGVHVLLSRWLTAGVEAQAGWSLGTLRGLVEGQRGVEYGGPWVSAVAAVGARW
jgi:hypothetical protein